MKKIKPQKSFKRLFLNIFLSLIGILFVLILFIRLSPGHNTNIPWGHRQIQIHVDRGIRVFYPKDDTTYYYFNNFDPMQVITGTDTTFRGFESQPGTYVYPKASFTTQNKPNNSSQSNGIYVAKATQIPQSTLAKTIHSKNLNLTFTIPDGVSASYDTLFNGEIEVLTFKKGYKMDVYITDYSKSGKADYCNDTKADLSYGKTVLLANQIELGFPATDRDFRKGWTKDIVYKNLPDKKVCIDIMQEKGDSPEKIFDQILETAKFN